MGHARRKTRLKPVPKTTLAARIMELERVLRQRVNGKKDRHDVAKDFLHRILSRGEHKDPKLRKARPAANPFASWASRRTLNATGQSRVTSYRCGKST